MTYFLNRQQGRTALQNNPLDQNSWILSAQSSWEDHHPCWPCVSVYMFSLQRGGHGRKATWRSGASLPQAGCQWSPSLINWWYDWWWWYIVSLIWNIDGYSINHSNSAVRSWIHYLYSLIHNTDSLASNNTDSLAPNPYSLPAHTSTCVCLWYGITKQPHIPLAIILCQDSISNITASSSIFITPLTMAATRGCRWPDFTRRISSESSMTLLQYNIAWKIKT